MTTSWWKARASRTQLGNVELAVNRGLKSGKLDFLVLDPDEAIDLAAELLHAARYER